MPLLTLIDLPMSPMGKIGFPWTEASPPQYIPENLPKISIITPSFNQGKFIEETIRSVLLQGYPNLEYIIIDGGSTDETIEIIKKYSDFISYWVSEKDNGQSDAINKGLKKATGEVFNWLNSDDYYLPDALLTVGQAFKEKAEMNVFCGREVVLLPNGNLMNLNSTTTILPTLEATIAIGNFCQPPTFFRLIALRQLGDLSDKLHFCMDADLWLRYLTKFGLENVQQSPKVLNVFRIHPQAKSSNAKKIYYADRFNLLMALVNNSQFATNFPTRFLKDNAIFTIYFNQSYPLSNINEKWLLLQIAEQLLNYYSQFMSWRAFFDLYIYSFRQLPYGRKRRFYLSPLIKFKRLFRPITF